MAKSKPINAEICDPFQSSFSPFNFLSFEEVAVTREDYDWVRRESHDQDTIDTLLALIIASAIRKNRNRDGIRFNTESFQGLCNTVKYLYDFNNTRFDGEQYWFSPKKWILERIKKYRRK